MYCTDFGGDIYHFGSRGSLPPGQLKKRKWKFATNMYELSSVFDEGSIREEGDVEFDGIFNRRIFTPSVVSILIACTYRFFYAYPCMCQGEITGNI